MIILFMPLASFISLQGAFLAVLFVHLAINEYFCRKVTTVMYRGFNLLLEENCFEQDDFKKLQEVGFKSISHQKTIIIEKINSFVGDNGSLDGSKMQANWFPQIKADIFISHSHKDENLALALAGWLKVTFGLSAFIDSCVWGYANDLLRIIDDRYCRNVNRNSYNYNKRNYSTSHVHMMLSVALSQMIDNTECLFFLNTPHSLTPNTTINQTESPWIYSEIAISRLVRKKKLEEYRNVALLEYRQFSSVIKDTLKVQYDLPTDHLTDIDADILIRWENSWKIMDSFNEQFPQYSEDLKIHTLDKLYELTK